MGFSEEFLHFIWQFRLYATQELHTTNGDKLVVISPGTLNKNAGPDFSNAKALLAGILWAGDVEIHIKSSDWLVHQHQHDRAYDSVVLHVVYEADVPVYRSDGSLLPVFVLKGLVPNYLFDKYEGLITASHSFPCEKQIQYVDRFLIRNSLTRVMIERLVTKSLEIEATLKQLKGDWEATFYRFLAKSFGFKVNVIPMEMLAQSLPFQLYAKHKDQPRQIEALIFGQAGFLNQRFVEKYPKELRREYLYLKRKYGLQPIEVSLWKFMRMRPQNFPTIRLAQFAALLCTSSHLFAKVLTINDHEKLENYFENLPVHEFWKSHYHFNQQAQQVSVQIGKASRQHILINTVSLFLFVYGQQTDQDQFTNHALNLLERIPPEKNAIIKQYSAAGVIVENAFTSQALLQLKKKYCNEKKCLNCGIGIQILKQ